MKTVGYARISTDESKQSTELQIDALRGIGADPIFTDHISGASKPYSRPGLSEALKALEPGDTLAVLRIDRLGRKLSDLILLLDELHNREVIFVSISEAIDTRTPMGMAVFQIAGLFAELERSMISQRVKEGIAAARKRNIFVGRKRSLLPDQVELARELEAQGLSIRKIARKLGKSHPAVGRALRNDFSH